MGNVVKCDVTGQPVSLNDGVLVVNRETGQWYFCSQEGEEQVPNKSSFPPVDRVVDQEGLIDLLAYLGNKPWFDPARFFQKIAQLKPY
ncbi:hypothetical protein [Halomonas sp. FME65]|uniref:hypothetical protein n=1 Tax=Halomonas sp. FME65 TaxID=2742614 RepID=UPI001865D663|nr:hypothetical protein [Halomonas sp. FME65]